MARRLVVTVIPADDARELDRWAERQGATRAALIRQIIHEFAARKAER